MSRIVYDQEEIRKLVNSNLHNEFKLRSLNDLNEETIDFDYEWKPQQNSVFFDKEITNDPERAIDFVFKVATIKAERMIVSERLGRILKDNSKVKYFNKYFDQNKMPIRNYLSEEVVCPNQEQVELLGGIFKPGDIVRKLDDKLFSNQYPLLVNDIIHQERTDTVSYEFIPLINNKDSFGRYYISIKAIKKIEDSFKLIKNIHKEEEKVMQEEINLDTLNYTWEPDINTVVTNASPDAQTNINVYKIMGKGESGLFSLDLIAIIDFSNSQVQEKIDLNTSTEKLSFITQHLSAIRPLNQNEIKLLGGCFTIGDVIQMSEPFDDLNKYPWLIDDVISDYSPTGSAYCYRCIVLNGNEGNPTIVAIPLGQLRAYQAKYDVIKNLYKPNSKISKYSNGENIKPGDRVFFLTEDCHYKVGKVVKTGKAEGIHVFTEDGPFVTNEEDLTKVFEPNTFLIN